MGSQAIWDAPASAQEFEICPDSNPNSKLAAIRFRGSHGGRRALIAKLSTVLGLILIVSGIVLGRWGCLLCWLGLSFFWAGIAYTLGVHSAFAKRSNGTIPWWSWVLHLPFFCYTSLIWEILRWFNPVPAWNRVNDNLYIGRRLADSELFSDFDNYVDLTAEFQDAREARKMPGFLCFPILDASAPSAALLKSWVKRLRPGRTYIHCAQGYGRTGLFAAAFLLNSGEARTAGEALDMLSDARPGVHLNSRQRKCIQEYIALLRAEIESESDQPRGNG
jgi:protein-tyrosine phosphatase